MNTYKIYANLGAQYKFFYVKAKSKKGALKKLMTYINRFKIKNEAKVTLEELNKKTSVSKIDDEVIPVYF